MPVTAKLSKAFYDRLGDDVANELVDWFNMVDATYRSDLREINELNFARFDAKVEQRFAEFGVKIEQRLASVGSELTAQLNRRFDSVMQMIVLSWATILATLIALRFV